MEVGTAKWEVTVYISTDAPPLRYGVINSLYTHMQAMSAKSLQIQLSLDRYIRSVYLSHTFALNINLGVK